MKAALAKRISDLERRREGRSRQMHIIKARDQADLDRQMVQLLDSGAMGTHDGLLCLTGRPGPH